MLTAFDFQVNDRVSFDMRHFGLEGIITGTIIGAAMIPVPVLGASLIVLTDEVAPDGTRALALFEAWLEKI